jgi:hypothetical protein
VSHAYPVNRRLWKDHEIARVLTTFPSLGLTLSVKFSEDETYRIRSVITVDAWDTGVESLAPWYNID